MAMPKQKPGQSKQDYATPRDFLGLVKARLCIEDFDIDLAASPENAVTGRFYTEKDDALQQPWNVGNGWNWCNPPYADIGPWVDKASYESQYKGAQTVMLIPASVGANWWYEYVEPCAYQTILNGRLAFIPDKPDWLYPKDCTLLLYTPWCMVGREIWKWRPET